MCRLWLSRRSRIANLQSDGSDKQATPLDSSVGHLEHGSLLHGIRQLMLMNGAGHQLQWTKAHPERTKPRMDWTADDQGIYMADLVAGELATLHREVTITTYLADADELLASLVPGGQWVWMADNRIFMGSLRQRAQCHQFQQYLNRRDTERIHQNTPSRWTQFSSGLMTTQTYTKNADLQERADDWSITYLTGWHMKQTLLTEPRPGWQQPSAPNVAAWQRRHTLIQRALILLDLRLLYKWDIDHHLLCLRHTVLPPSQRWVSLLMSYVEDHMWEDSERAGDI